MEIWVDSGDFSEDSMESISEIFSHHFSDEGWEDEREEDGLTSGMISRSRCLSLSRTRSGEILEKSSSNAEQHVRLAMESEGRRRPVILVEGLAKSASKYAQYLVSSSKQEYVGHVVVRVRRS